MVLRDFVEHLPGTPIGSPFRATNHTSIPLMASCPSSHSFLPPPLRRPRPFGLRQLAPRIPIRRSRCTLARSLASPSDPAASSASSWFPSDRNPSRADGYGGWSVPVVESPKRNDASRFAIGAAGVGISVAAAVVAAVSYLYFSRKLPQFQIVQPLHYISEFFQATESGESQGGGKKIEVEVRAGDADFTGSVATEDVPEQPSIMSMYGEKRHKIIPVAADSMQLEAIDILKKLNIIESDVLLSDICTRREYARWLVKANILLERNVKYKIAPSMLIAGSADSAFDDISIDDPDFLYIQAIGEAGIIPSKLSYFGDESKSGLEAKHLFAPESYLTRIDLLSWKTQLEYTTNIGTDERMLRKNVGFTDLAAVAPDTWHGLFFDTLAGERSITRRVFGNTKRLQPMKPVTKAQAAVAISSGRMAEAICIEVSRMEAENVARQINKKDIESELIKKGEIQRYWEEKMCEERNLCLITGQELSEVSNELEKEKVIHRKEMESHVKEKAAVDCQKRLLMGLEVEIDAMRQRLANEKAVVVSERQNVEALLMDLQEKQRTILEAKSILEAEKEALRILRTWMEDGARQTQSRVKILGDAVQRWKWDGQTGFSDSSLKKTDTERS